MQKQHSPRFAAPNDSEPVEAFCSRFIETPTTARGKYKPLNDKSRAA
jgi:hypothetical protein